MSLDVHLLGDPREEVCVCSCGHEHPATRVPRLFSANITHNLGSMAKEAGIYMPLWRPEELGIASARELIAPLRDGLALMRADPARFGALDAENGWGTYTDFVPWIARYLAACEKYPGALVYVSR